MGRGKRRFSTRVDGHPEICFREDALGRRAMLAGTRLYVWQVIDTVHNCGGSIEEAASYLNLPVARVEAAVSYYAMHKEEVDRERRA